MIEPGGSLEPEPPPPPRDDGPESEPVVLEDLTAVVRIPVVFRKIDRVLREVRRSFPEPEDFPLDPVDGPPGEGLLDYGLRWEDPYRKLRLFAGMAWGDGGHDPVWEVRLEALPALDPEALRAGGLHRRAARRAEGRFTEWDRFWHEDKADRRLLIGASAACTRFLEEEDPDRFAAEYLAGALYALHASGALQALVQAAREAGGPA